MINFHFWFPPLSGLISNSWSIFYLFLHHSSTAFGQMTQIMTLSSKPKTITWKVKNTNTLSNYLMKYNDLNLIWSNGKIVQYFDIFFQKKPVWNGFQTISARWHVISHWYEIPDYVHVSIFDFYVSCSRFLLLDFINLLCLI